MTTDSPLDSLSTSLELQQATLEAARAAAGRTRQELDELLSQKVPKYSSEDTSVVVFGSLARDEWTEKSDLDWTYLIDGQANSDHLVISQAIGQALDAAGYKGPGKTGTFGNLAFSHDIIHQIGGQYDTNKNTTQRILLLLESTVVGPKGAPAYERVIRGVINRYLEEDTHLLTPKGDRYRVPRFLLNDIVRFWRTMAVDFASKQRYRGGAGWGLRNAKLRMSRKLIFASGLLMCFSCCLDSELQAEISTAKDDTRLKLVNYLRKCVRMTPLEVLAHAVQKYSVSEKVVRELFGAYEEFLQILSNPDKRGCLESLRAENSRTDSLFGRVRDISHNFQSALDNIFFENAAIGPLTRQYGLF